VLLAHKEHKVMPELLVPKEMLEQQVLRVLTVPQEQQDQKEQQDRKEHLVIPELLVADLLA
jgi:hypothetical protein